MAKALGPDLRLAVLAGDAQTVARVQGRQQCGPGWVSHILQRLVLALWSDPARGRRSRAPARRTRSGASGCSTCLRRRGMRAHGASGLNVWVPVEDEAGVVGALLRAAGCVAPGAPYRLAGERPAIRITTATLGEQRRSGWPATSPTVLAPLASSRSG